MSTENDSELFAGLPEHHQPSNLPNSPAPRAMGANDLARIRRAVAERPALRATETTPKNDAIIVSTSYDEVTGRMTFHDPVPVLPTADAPTAEEIEAAFRFAMGNAAHLNQHKTLDVLAWVESRLPSLIAADAIATLARTYREASRKREDAEKVGDWDLVAAYDSEGFDIEQRLFEAIDSNRNPTNGR